MSMKDAGYKQRLVMPNENHKQTKKNRTCPARKALSDWESVMRPAGSAGKMHPLTSTERTRRREAEEAADIWIRFAYWSCLCASCLCACEFALSTCTDGIIKVAPSSSQATLDATATGRVQARWSRLDS